MSNGIGDPDRLYNLMPAVYRERDEQQGFPLRGLLRLVAGQSDIVYADIQQLWDNFFIETCDRWAVPYIGDLVGNNLLNDAQNLQDPDTARDLFPDLAGPDLRPPNAIRTRADVAKTIYYRRRKGTLPMLEELARDVTGWAAHAVEFFELLIWSQNLNHVRLFSTGCPDLRNPEAVDRLNGPFDFMSHTVDVRYPAQSEGWHNIRNIGFFLWRLRSYPMENVVARQGALPWQYTFSPLGNPAPLFSRLRPEGDPAGLATELHVPGPIRPAAFFKDIAPLETMTPPLPDFTDFYGLFQPFAGSLLTPNTSASLVVIRDGVPVPPGQVRCRNLETFAQPAGNIVGIDVRRGRMAFGTTFVPAQSVDVFYHYGFSADLGGGPYQRSKWLVDAGLPAVRMNVRENGGAPDFPTLDAAIAAWVTGGRPNTVITILDNRDYRLSSPISLADDRFLAIQADDRMRPHITVPGGELQVKGNHPGAELTLSGLLFEGAVHLTGETRRLRILHTTLVPGRALNHDGTPATLLPGITVDALDAGGAVINAAFRLEIAFSITGPLRVPNQADSMTILDSIIDGLGGAAIADTGTNNQPGPPVSLERVTILGRSFFRKITLATEVIFADPVIAAQRQAGCVRFSFVPFQSITPQRYRCQPDLEIQTQLEKAGKSGPLTAAQRTAITALVRARVVPSFTSIHYGDPGYAQLRLGCPVEIRTGADDGSEMGVFCHLKQPERETNLRIRLEEYLPFGLDAGIIYVT
ncbi:MAG TPA: hypothetical protein VNY05_14855 [Candidatus Acidoferrales bacterium]|jgi:hypothetical protein|nr:hypothetical protein [Candidatus Acidoferrales bacterium]